MPGHEEFTSLEALPPFVGDSAVAAVLLRDVVASLHAPYGAVSAKSIEVGDSGRFQAHGERLTGSPVSAARAPLAAPELFDGVEPDERTDVYAAACLVLTHYLGSTPVPSVAHALRAPARVRLAAVRQAHRTQAPRLGAIEDPFRAAFAQAMAKQPYLRPSAAQLTALLDAAFAATGGTAEADARARVRRLIALARAFVPTGDAAAAASLPVHTQPERSVIPLRTLPAFARPHGVARAALIAAVAIVATGGVAVAAVVGISSGPNRTPQADITQAVPTPTASASPSTTPVAATSTVATTSAPATTKAAAPATTPPPAAGSGGGSDNGSDNGGSDNSGSDNSGSGGSGSGGSGSHSSTPKPPTHSSTPTHSSAPPTHSSAPPTSTSPTPTDPVPTITPTTSTPPVPPASGDDSSSAQSSPTS